MLASELIKELEQLILISGDKKIFIDQTCDSCDDGTDKLDLEDDLYIRFVDQDGSVEVDDSRCGNCVGFVLLNPSWS
jgi:hypothetical protein